MKVVIRCRAVAEAVLVYDVPSDDSGAVDDLVEAAKTMARVAEPEIVCEVDKQ